MNLRNLHVFVKAIYFKLVFHFNCIVAKRGVFHCFVNTQAELRIYMDIIEYPTFRYDIVEVENGL